MSDSSSEDEERFKLNQAIDTNFISDDLFCKKLGSEVKLNESKPSLRYQDEHENQSYNLAGLNLTPEFQKFVAKQLSNFLDQQVKVVKHKKVDSEKCSRSDNGIRLLHSSPSYVVLTNQNLNQPMKRKCKDIEVDSEEEKMKLNESAVSADWILSGEAIRGWVKSTRGEVLTGNLKDSSTNGTSKKKKKKKKMLQTKDE